MAKYICCYSGLEITTSHFPLYLSSRTNHEACHPIFHAPQKSLIAYAAKWSAQELTKIDGYLLYLALLKSTDLVWFRTSCNYIPREVAEETKQTATDSIIAHSMEHLMRIIGRINAISNPHIRFPEVIIDENNNNLWTSRHWIENWNRIYDDYNKGIRDQETLVRLKRRETALEKLIRTPHRRIEYYAKDLAEWADDAASFPTYEVFDGLEQRKIPLNEYYKEIIIHACAKEFYKVRKADLIELIETCALTIEFATVKGENSGGTIHSHLLFKVLQEAEIYLKALIHDPAELPLAKHRISDTFTFVEDDEDDLEEFMPGVTALIQSTPEEKPERSAFSTQFEYIKAKIKWEAAQTAKQRMNGSNKGPDVLGFN